jgi:hypothetical protein
VRSRDGQRGRLRDRSIAALPQEDDLRVTVARSREGWRRRLSILRSLRYFKMTMSRRSLCDRGSVGEGV